MRSMLAETGPGEEGDTPHSSEIDDETSVRTIQQLAGVDVEAAKDQENWGRHWNDFVRVREKVRSRRKEANPSPEYKYDLLLRRWDHWISPDNNPILARVLPGR